MQPLWWVARSLEFGQQFETFVQQLFTNPAAALEYVVELAEFDWPTHLAQLVPVLQSPQLIAAAIGGAVANLGAVTGLAGLSGLAAIQPGGIVAVAPPVTATPLLPVAGTAPGVVASAVSAAPAPAPATTAGTVTPAGPTPPTAGGAPGGFGYPFLVGGGPGIGFGSGMSAGASASARRKASEPDSAAAAATASAREQARRRRRRGGVQREYGDEFADLHVFADMDVEPDWAAPPAREPELATVASGRGAANQGFTGTLRNESVDDAAGMTALAGDEFDGGPRMPMLPRTWDPDRS
jgi:hypothetical protein